MRRGWCRSSISHRNPMEKRSNQKTNNDMGNLVAKTSISIKAEIKDVWKALTDPALIKKYFFGTDAESDWKKGSPVRFRGEWEGKPYEDKGTVLESDPPRKL